MGLRHRIDESGCIKHIMRFTLRVRCIDEIWNRFPVASVTANILPKSAHHSPTYVESFPVQAANALDNNRLSGGYSCYDRADRG